MVTVLSPPEERVLLRDVSWETYERLLREQGDRRTPRFTHDRGRLEIMSPSDASPNWAALASQTRLALTPCKMSARTPVEAD